ncbi:bifunctional SulP family inorganic anion transporter/carbonic anhydrase [Rhodococcus sp. HNM0569]|uniref:SulP family inorganic anion transporter n=1 Tax=Rhodococcus sp. HNM0569 TaxID=2716340 RepID=UPI001469A0B4|nr:bifunctional SulP family inorganic anion transporter/carbonic anhydrase [Rhodococcus sp. HNM0569]NLU82700.1 bifunctional SulP family inorganic anion transporter/carbonic anhydrase [Rhodococcus sp. HNM0569]
MQTLRKSDERDRPPAGSTGGDGPPPLRERVASVTRYDLPASLVVFLVALPLSIGIAIASGAPVMAGLIAAVVGGIVAGAVGGSPLQVTGPAAGLTVVVAELVDKFGWQATCAITVAAGVLQIVFGLSGIARAALAIAPVVVHAMLAGIGVTIALQQIHVLLGGSSHSTVVQNLTELPGQLFSPQWDSAAIGILVVVIMVGWKRLPDRMRMVPGPLVAVVVATIVSLLVPMDVPRIQLDGSLFDAIALPSLPDGPWLAVATGVLTVALIASVESLLSAVAVDKMHDGPRTEFSRELVGQGTANVISGAVGGLPVTGVIVRSSTNVAVGARTRASAILHGIWILVFAVLLTGLVQQVPMAALAGLLVVIGLQLVKLADITKARRTGDAWIYGVTIAGVVFLNLLEGVLIGLALAVILLLWRVIRPSIAVERGAGENTWTVTVEGPCSFLSLPKLTSLLSRIPERADVTIELAVDFLDHAAWDAIDQWATHHRRGGGRVTIETTGPVAVDEVGSAPPTRRSALAPLPGFVPWRHWQSKSAAEPPKSPALRPVRDGVAEYHRRGAPRLRTHLDGLRDGQRPDTLFLTCADSRVVPNVITSSGPGDLFTIRNVGNLVPSGAADDSVEAALEFAVGELGVSSVVVCGHSGCGAMTALLSDESPGTPAAIDRWLTHADASVRAFRSGHPAARAAAELGLGAVDQLGVTNVAVQVQTLMRHPLVGEAFADGRLRVAGLFFDIASAEVLEVTPTGVARPHAPAFAT